MIRVMSGVLKSRLDGSPLMLNAMLNVDEYYVESIVEYYKPEMRDRDDCFFIVTVYDLLMAGF